MRTFGLNCVNSYKQDGRLQDNKPGNFSIIKNDDGSRFRFSIYACLKLFFHMLVEVCGRNKNNSISFSILTD